jgi:hypothetical protein
MGKKSGSGSGIRNEQLESCFLELRNHFFVLKYLNFLIGIRDGNNSDPGYEIRDLGWKKGGSGRSGINIPDPQHWENQC